MTGEILILLGSNLGDRIRNISTACDLISRQIGPIITKSSYYNTTAWGNTDQPDFINQVIEIESGSSPNSLLESCLEIEKSLGRVRNRKWESRVIDIDILFYSNLVVQTKTLTIPHPEIQKRRFTLIPLKEIRPELIHPVLNKTVSELLQECADTSEVSLVKTTGS